MNDNPFDKHPQNPADETNASTNQTVEAKHNSSVIGVVQAHSINNSTINIHVDSRTNKDEQSSKTNQNKKLNNLPHRNRFFTGRVDVLNQLADLIKYNQQVAIKQAISGMGGVGKTQTALEFCYRHTNDYQTIFWINAEKESSFNISYWEVAYLLELVELGNPKSLKDDYIIFLVKRWFTNNSNWLMVLDNLEDTKLIKDYLPSNHQGHVLITTQQHDLGVIAKTITLDKMDSNTGSLFLLKRIELLSENDSLDKADPNDLSVAQEIVKEMDGLPLALDQAGAYIRQTQSRLQEYLDLYKNAKHAAKLRDKRGKHTDDHISVTATFQLAFNKVKEKNSTAPKVLEVCSFLDPNLIPEEIFTQAGNFLNDELAALIDDPFLWREVLELLFSYSLVKRDTNNKSLSIHRLVQAVIRDLIGEENKKLLVESLVNSLLSLFPKNLQDSNSWFQYKNLSPSVLKLFDLANEKTITLDFRNAATLFDLVGIYCAKQFFLDQAMNLFSFSLNIFKEFYSNDFLDIAKCLMHKGITLSSKADYAQALNNLQEAIFIFKNNLSDSHLSIATCQVNIGNVYGAQNKYADALDYHQQALSTYKKYKHMIKDNYLYKYYIAACYNNIGEIYRKLAKYNKAVTKFNDALSIRKLICEKNSIDIAEVFSNLSIVYTEQNKYPQALECAKKALLIRKEIFSEDHPDFAHSLENFAVAYNKQDNYTEALNYYQKSLRIKEKFFTNNHPQLADTFTNIATVYSKQAEYKKALYYYKKALFINKKVFGYNHSNIATILDNMGSVYFDCGRYSKASCYYNKALSIRKSIFDENNHPDIADSLNHIGNIYSYQSDFEQALDNYNQALTINQKVFGTNLAHVKIASNISNIASIHFKRENYEEALKTYQNILSIYKSIFGKKQSHLLIANTVTKIASIYSKQNKHKEAQDSFLESLNIKKSILGCNHPKVAETLQNLGLFYQDIHKEQLALDSYQQALTIYDEFLPSNHPHIIQLLNQYSQLLINLNKTDQAQPLLDRLASLEQSP